MVQRRATLCGCAVGVIVLAAVAGGGCGSGTKPVSSSPLADAKSAGLAEKERTAAAERAWRESAANAEDRRALTASFKDMAWDPRTPTPVRARVLDLMIDDPDPAAAQEGRSIARLMLPREQSRAMVAYICQRIAAGGWKECTPALVRSYAHPVPGVPDAERGERVALVALYPDRAPEQVVFEMFLHPPAPEPDVTIPDWTERLRAESWELLGRLDSEGTIRAALLTGSSGVGNEDAAVRALRRCREELGCVPITGEELKWLLSLSDSTPENAAWWSESARAVQSLPASSRAGLHLCDIEPVRWAAANRSAWLAASRDDLLAELEKRLEERKHRRRTIDANEFHQPISQRLQDWRDQMRWGDVLAVLVVDEALHAPTVSAAIFQQAALDQRDTSTEFGGLLESIPAPPGAFRTRMFPPRPGQRLGDQRFVASEDLVAAADRALVLYHFHVQRWHNDAYAGPSRDDLAFAVRSGRLCAVFTSIDEDTLNVDFYQPEGIILDLGDLTR